MVIFYVTVWFIILSKCLFLNRRLCQSMVLATLAVQLMAKALCKWKKKDIEHNIHELIDIVSKPKFICKDCARAAGNKNYLCKPIKLS